MNEISSLYKKFGGQDAVGSGDMVNELGMDLNAFNEFCNWWFGIFWGN